MTAAPAPLGPLLERAASVAGTQPAALSDRQLAELCGVTTRTVSRWKHNGTVPAGITDTVAIRLGWHPAAVWGIDWYLGAA